MKVTRNKSSSSDDCASEIISPKRSLQHATSSQNKRLFANSSLCDLSVSQLKALVSTLNHTLGRDKTESYQHILHEECIDGFCLSQLGCDELAGIGFDPNVKTLFKEILNFSNMKSLLMQATSPPNALALNPSQPSNSQHMALNISAVPCPPPLHTYGQLVVLGSREHRITNEQVIYATGSSNDVFPLVRQSVASGVKIVTENVYLCQEKVDRDSGESVHVSFVDSKQLSFVRQSDECGSVASFRMVLDTSPELLHKISPRGRQGSRPVAEETSALLPYMFEAIFGPDSAFDMFQVGRHDGTFTVDNYDNVSSSLGATPAIRRVNDVVIKGLVVNGQTSRGVASRVAAHKGAVSRVACRVLCERSTGRAFLFAGGFSASKVQCVHSCIVMPHLSCIISCVHFLFIDSFSCRQSSAMDSPQIRHIFFRASHSHKQCRQGTPITTRTFASQLSSPKLPSSDYQHRSPLRRLLILRRRTSTGQLLQQ